MKRAIPYIIFSFILASLSLSAQDAISYQAVARNTEGKILSEQQIGVKVEILQGSTEGAAVYSETHEATTSPTGVVNLSIGNGTESSGAFSDIDWGASTYFLKLSMDTEGGKEYLPVSTTQIMPVPVALYAKEAGAVKGKEDSEMPKYALGTILDSDSFFEHLDGYKDPTYLEETGEWFLGIAFTILYLDGIDHQLEATVEGIDGISIDTTRNSPSSPIGRTIRIGCTYKNKAENASLVIKDKEGKSLQSIPFKIIYDEY